MRTYEFHSALPPEALQKELDRWVRVENILLHKSGKVKIKWKGRKFTLSMTKREGSTTTFLCPLRGEVFSDGQGGSFLHGEEFLSRTGHICFAIAMGTCAAGVLVAPDPITKRIFIGIGVVIAGSWVLEPVKTTVNSPELEQFLTKNFEELEA